MNLVIVLLIVIVLLMAAPDFMRALFNLVIEGALWLMLGAVILGGALLLTGCSTAPPVTAYDSQAELKQDLCDRGLPQGCVPYSNPYAATVRDHGAPRILVWRNAPPDYWCLVAHERSHIGPNGERIDWHPTNEHNSECGDETWH